MAANGQIRFFRLSQSNSLAAMKDEIREYTAVLLGHQEPPVHVGVLTLMELAEAYGARAREMSMQIQDAEVAGTVPRGSAAYKFRTGMLRTFIELADHAMQLGSRRVTVMEQEGRY